MNGTWIDKFAEIIPKQVYTTHLSAGEDKGVIVTLSSDLYEVTISFGAVQAIQMLDEGVLLNGGDTEQLKTLRAQGFPSAIYEIGNGDFGRFIETQMGSDLYHALGCRQYNIVTLNYVIFVVSPWEPQITVAHKQLSPLNSPL